MNKSQLILNYLGLQNTLCDFQERYGRTTTMNQFLRSEYNGLSDEQLKSILDLSCVDCGISQEISCCYVRSRPCQCLAIYRACGQLPSPVLKKGQEARSKQPETLSLPDLRE